MDWRNKKKFLTMDNSTGGADFRRACEQAGYRNKYFGFEFRIMDCFPEEYLFEFINLIYLIGYFVYDKINSGIIFKIKFDDYITHLQKQLEIVFRNGSLSEINDTYLDYIVDVFMGDYNVIMSDYSGIYTAQEYLKLKADYPTRVLNQFTNKADCYSLLCNLKKYLYNYYKSTEARNFNQTPLIESEIIGFKSLLQDVDSQVTHFTRDRMNLIVEEQLKFLFKGTFQTFKNDLLRVTDYDQLYDRFNLFIDTEDLIAYIYAKRKN